MFGIRYLLGITTFAMLMSCGIKAPKNFSAPPSLPSDTATIVLLAGQSNMAGAGNYEALSPDLQKRIEAVADRVELVNGNKKIGPLSWYSNKPSEKYNFTRRFGPELLLGLTLAERHPDRRFLLIKHARGGTALYGSWSPEWTAEKAKAIEKGPKQGLRLLEEHLAIIHAQLARLDAAGTPHRIIGMAWMQGENDAKLPESTSTYAASLGKLIARYRTEFDIPQMPFVFGQINSRYGMKGGASIVRAQMKLAAKADPLVTMIPTTTNEDWRDFPKHADNVHYNAEGQRRLGIRFAEVLLDH